MLTAVGMEYPTKGIKVEYVVAKGAQSSES